MNNQEIEFLKEDLLKILNSKFYTTGATKTDIANELRQNGNSNVKLKRKWKLSEYFINGELESIAEAAGIKVVYSYKGKGPCVTKTVYSL